jgi:hypothetical protein
MAIAKHPLSTVTELDLQFLIAGGVREDRTLEFKKDTYGANDDARAEFLADISALANTLGGDLVLGLEEDQGTAAGLPGLRAGIDIDQEILRLTQIAQSGLQPRLPRLELQPIPLACGRHCLVIRVERSFQGPHRVIFKGRNRFWARSSVGKYEPDVDELRVLFGAAPQLAARIREMRADRVTRVIADETPVPLMDKPGRIILHIIPLAAADAVPHSVDLNRLRSYGVWFPWGASSYNEHRNFDGFVAYSGAERENSRAYIQVFRSGMIEVVAVHIVDVHSNARIVRVPEIASRFLRQVRALAEVLRETGVDAPYSVHLTVSGVRGATFIVPNPSAFVGGQESPFPIQRDVLSFVDVLLTESDIAPPQLEVALKPTLDQLFSNCRACMRA